VSLSTEGFTYLGTLKVPAVSGATSVDTALVIRGAAYTTAMIADLKSDGGDVRFSGDIGGNTQYPIEVVDGLDIVWTLIPSVAVDTLVYVWGNKPAAVKEIDTATYGSEAVWVNSKMRAHLGATVYDSTGNTSLNFDNSIEDLAGQIGSARDYDGNTQYGRFTDANANSNLQGKGKSSVWFKPDSGLSGKAAICFDRSSTSSYKHLLYISGGSSSVNAFIRLSNGNTYSAGLNTGGTITGWHRLTATFDRSLATQRLKVYYDGALVSTDDAENLDVATNNDGVSLGRWGNNRLYKGSLDEYDLSTDVTADKETIEYQNQAVTSGAWWIATDAGGGGGTTTPLTLTYSAVAASSIAKSLDLSLALSYAGTGTATTDTASTFNLTKSYTATGTSAIAKLIQKTLAYLGIGTNSIAKEVAVTKEYSATGTAEQEESLVTEIAFSYTASALLTLAAQFILKPIVTAGKGYSIAGVYTAFKGYKVKAGYLYETVFKPTE
jgi:hypothetical protein